MDTITQSTRIPNAKTSIACFDMPEELFDTETAKKHFGKFGKVTKILLRPKSGSCVVEYESHESAYKAHLNAGAFDGFMFDVVWNKRKRKKSKVDDDPEWLPDSDVEDELLAMNPSLPIKTRLSGRIDNEEFGDAVESKPALRKKPQKLVPTVVVTHPPEQPLSVVVGQVTMSSTEAAVELIQIKQRVSRTADEQRRTLEARDRILRAWGGTGARVKIGGATVGTCPDMCPEKERLQRQAERQFFAYELDQNGNLSPQKAVKQYSRSSADQEAPMCYELRPPRVLSATANYLLRNIVPLCDSPNVSLADWFHFLWDRLRGIRKDITQQALCCEESVRLVEQCARFHTHCGARLVSLSSADFDQRLNTDNLTKCLQTLKHMYADINDAKMKPFEPEFRGYIALLNLNDTNFFWEIKRLPEEIQKSEPITFAIQVFSAMDNNNYVRFFRLVRDKATYLQACILLRYFNDVRARALARLVKAFSLRGDSKYPAQELCEALAFEDIDNLQLFVENYGLTVGEGEDENLYIVLNRNHFVEDSDPYASERAINLVESKLKERLSKIIAGGDIPEDSIKNPHSSFDAHGILKETALLALDQGYGTQNDTDKSIEDLKTELNRVARNWPVKATSTAKQVKPDLKQKSSGTFDGKFEFSSAIPVTKSPPKPYVQSQDNTFQFSKPATSPPSIVWSKPIDTSPQQVFGKGDKKQNVLTSSNTNLFQKPRESSDPFKRDNVFGLVSGENPAPVSKENVFSTAPNIFTNRLTDFAPANVFQVPNTAAKQASNAFKKPTGISIFGSKSVNQNKTDDLKSLPDVFQANDQQTASTVKTDIFAKASSTIFGEKSQSIPQNLFSSKPTSGIFEQNANKSIFGSAKSSTNLLPENTLGNLFAKPEAGNIFGETNKYLFGKPIEIKGQPPGTIGSSIFGVAQSKMPKDSGVEAIAAFNQGDKTSAGLFVQSIQNQQTDEEELKRQEEQERFYQAQLEEQRKLEELRQEQARKLEEERRLVEQRVLEELKRQEELRRLEEQRLLEEKRKQDELKRKLEEEKRIAEEKRILEEKRKAEEARKKAEQERKRLIESIEKESQEVTEEIIKQLSTEMSKELLSEEIEKFQNLVLCSNTLTEELADEICKEICEAEIKAEQFLTRKLLTKFGGIWRTSTTRNLKRRRLVDRTPVWISDKSLHHVAKRFKRDAAADAISLMHSFHRGYKFHGELTPSPQLKTYNLTDIIHSSIFKRFKELKYSFSDNVYWKLSLSIPGTKKYLRYDMEIDKWIRSVFNKNSKESANILYLSNDYWNCIVQFAISVTMMDSIYTNLTARISDGSNGILVYGFDDECELLERLQMIAKNKNKSDVVPLAVIMVSTNVFDKTNLRDELNKYMNDERITAFRIYVCEKTLDSIDKNTKLALKWIARNLPEKPTLRIDLLKDFLHCTVGNEFWYRLRLERHTRMDSVFKDISKICGLFNEAVDKIIDIVSEDVINYCPNFPKELQQFLPVKPFPKTYEFFPDDWFSETNKVLVENIINSLHLPKFKKKICPKSYDELQDSLKSMIVGLDWFENYKEAYYKVVSVIPNEFSDKQLSTDDFLHYFSLYDFIDVLHMLTAEKINQISDDVMVVYDKSTLESYRNDPWWYKSDIVSPIKHIALEYEEDSVDKLLNSSLARRAKRLRFSSDFDETFQEKDVRSVDTTLIELDTSLTKMNNCQEAVKMLETTLAKEATRSASLEETLLQALKDN